MQGNKEFGFDMRDTLVGDKFITRGGEIVKLIDKLPIKMIYRYVIESKDRVFGVTKLGFFVAGKIDALDIIGFADTESKPEVKMILTTDSAARKQIPITTGVLDYFPLAIAEVAKCSKAGNDQHHAGEPLHWDKSKSTDHADCIARHLVDRGSFDTDNQRHSAKLAWRALALLQIELENEQKGKSA